MPKKDIEIIYEDGELVVVNKPAGVSVTADRASAFDLPSLLQKQLRLENLLRVVCRLDKFTSGAIILAKTRDAQSRYSSYFERRKIKQTYLGLVSGFAPGESGVIDTPISHNRKVRGLMRLDEKRGKPAITEYEVLADFGAMSLLAIRPVTIRTHQIRLHMASMGMPLAIDPLYGNGEGILLSDFKSGYMQKKAVSEKPLIDRLTLHCYQIEPIAEGEVAKAFVAGLDKKLTATIKMLTKYNHKGAEAFVDSNMYAKIMSGKAI